MDHYHTYSFQIILEASEITKIVLLNPQPRVQKTQATASLCAQTIPANTAFFSNLLFQDDFYHLKINQLFYFHSHLYFFNQIACPNSLFQPIILLVFCFCQIVPHSLLFSNLSSTVNPTDTKSLSYSCQIAFCQSFFW